MNYTRVANELNRLEKANNHDNEWDVRAAALSIIVATNARTINVLWKYPESFDDCRIGWDAIQEASARKYMIRGWWIAWRYYDLDSDK